MDKWLTEGSLGLGHFRSPPIPSPTPRGPWVHIPFVCLSFLLRMLEWVDKFKMLWYPNRSYKCLFTDLQHAGFYYLDLYIAWCGKYWSILYFPGPLWSAQVIDRNQRSWRSLHVGSQKCRMGRKGPNPGVGVFRGASRDLSLLQQPGNRRYESSILRLGIYHLISMLVANSSLDSELLFIPAVFINRQRSHRLSFGFGVCRGNSVRALGVVFWG